MNNDHIEPPVAIDLGTVSGDTQGDGGIYWEGFDHERRAGLSDD